MTFNTASDPEDAENVNQVAEFVAKKLAESLMLDGRGVTRTYTNWDEFLDTFGDEEAKE